MLQLDWAMCLEFRYHARFNSERNWEDYAIDKKKDALWTFASQADSEIGNAGLLALEFTNPTVQFVFGAQYG